MKLNQIFFPIACLFVAASTVAAESADFDRNEWEEVSLAEVEQGTTSFRRNLDDVPLFSEFDNASELEKRAKWSYNNRIVTWYNGKDLQNPFCYKNSSPRIKDSMRIGAMKNAKRCFQCVTITLTKKHPRRSDLVLRSTTRKTTVKIIDFCPSCDQNGEKVNDTHIDLSTSAFKDLGKIIDGELPITFKRVPCFKSTKWPRTPGKNV